MKKTTKHFLYPRASLLPKMCTLGGVYLQAVSSVPTSAPHRRLRCSGAGKGCPCRARDWVQPRMGSPPSPLKGTELQGGWEPYTGTVSVPQPADLSGWERRPGSLRQAVEGVPVLATPNLGGRRTIWPPALNFWPSNTSAGGGGPAHTSGSTLP